MKLPRITQNRRRENNIASDILGHCRRPPCFMNSERFSIIESEDGKEKMKQSESERTSEVAN